MNVDEIDRALEALEAEGARAFDAPACDCARTLYVRAEELGGSVGERLLARAAAHVEALRERFHAQRTRVDGALAALASVSGEQLALAQALHKGDIVSVARSIRRLRRQPRPPSSPSLPTKRTRVRPESAETENTSERTGVVATHAALPPHSSSTALEARRARRQRAASYEDSVADLVASFALARATDVVPDSAGPYNVLRIASQALDAMRSLSPSYLTVQLNRLEELASLLALPELPPKPKPQPPPRPLPNKKRGRTLKG